jgi:hypothetical protein
LKYKVLVDSDSAAPAASVVKCNLMVRFGTSGTNGFERSGDWAASKPNKASTVDVFILTLSAYGQV